MMNQIRQMFSKGELELLRPNENMPSDLKDLSLRFVNPPHIFPPEDDLSITFFHYVCQVIQYSCPTVSLRSERMVQALFDNKQKYVMDYDMLSFLLHHVLIWKNESLLELFGRRCDFNQLKVQEGLQPSFPYMFFEYCLNGKFYDFSFDLFKRPEGYVNSFSVDDFKWIITMLLRHTNIDINIVIGTFPSEAVPTVKHNLVSTMFDLHEHNSTSEERKQKLREMLPFLINNGGRPSSSFSLVLDCVQKHFDVEWFLSLLSAQEKKQYVITLWKKIGDVDSSIVDILVRHGMIESSVQYKLAIVRDKLEWITSELPNDPLLFTESLCFLKSVQMFHLLRTKGLIVDPTWMLTHPMFNYDDLHAENDDLKTELVSTYVQHDYVYYENDVMKLINVLEDALDQETWTISSALAKQLTTHVLSEEELVLLKQMLCRTFIQSHYGRVNFDNDIFFACMLVKLQPVLALVVDKPFPLNENTKDNSPFTDYYFDLYVPKEERGKCTTLIDVLVNVKFVNCVLALLKMGACSSFTEAKLYSGSLKKDIRLAILLNLFREDNTCLLHLSDVQFKIWILVLQFLQQKRASDHFIDEMMKCSTIYNALVDVHILPHEPSTPLSSPFSEPSMVSSQPDTRLTFSMKNEHGTSSVICVSSSVLSKISMFEDTLDEKTIETSLQLIPNLTFETFSLVLKIVNDEIVLHTKSFSSFSASQLYDLAWAIDYFGIDEKVRMIVMESIHCWFKKKVENELGQNPRGFKISKQERIQALTFISPIFDVNKHDVWMKPL
jgi:hypothetical protein